MTTSRMTRSNGSLAATAHAASPFATARTSYPPRWRIRVATPRMLYRMKRDTVRPLDRIDAEAIRERFRLAEEE